MRPSRLLTAQVDVVRQLEPPCRARLDDRRRSPARKLHPVRRPQVARRALRSQPVARRRHQIPNFPHRREVAARGSLRTSLPRAIPGPRTPRPGRARASARPRTAPHPAIPSPTPSRRPARRPAAWPPSSGRVLWSPSRPRSPPPPRSPLHPRARARSESAIGRGFPPGPPSRRCRLRRDPARRTARRSCRRPRARPTLVRRSSPARRPRLPAAARGRRRRTSPARSCPASACRRPRIRPPAASPHGWRENRLRTPGLRRAFRGDRRDSRSRASIPPSSDAPGVPPWETCTSRRLARLPPSPGARRPAPRGRPRSRPSPPRTHTSGHRSLLPPGPAPPLRRADTLPCPSDGRSPAVWAARARTMQRCARGAK